MFIRVIALHGGKNDGKFCGKWALSRLTCVRERESERELRKLLRNKK